MTYESNRNQPEYRDNETSYTSWIIGGVIAVALIIGGIMMFGRDAGTNNTASNTSRPAATSPATTGSGSATTPAPATAPATTPSTTPAPAR
jgi:hypothetical protein